jgi:CheY-like chemotaxis protein
MTQQSSIYESSPLSKKILVVDDDDLVRETYIANLAKNGFEPLVAHNGEEAWAMLETGIIPNLILTGIIMPRMTGFQLITKIKNVPRLAEVPIIILSHHGIPEHEQTAKELGVDDFIIKDAVSPGETVRRISLLVGLESSYHITTSTRRGDGRALLRLLNKLHDTRITPDMLSEVTLELRVDPQTKTFTITPYQSASSKHSASQVDPFAAPSS